MARATIVVRLEPERLKNPDLDLRYKLPDLLVEAAKGLVKDDGYDYAPPVRKREPALLLFLTTAKPTQASVFLRKFFSTPKKVLGNSLRSSCIVAISTKRAPKRNADFEVLHAPAKWRAETIVE